MKLKNDITVIGEGDNGYNRWYFWIIKLYWLAALLLFSWCWRYLLWEDNKELIKCLPCKTKKELLSKKHLEYSIGIDSTFAELSDTADVLRIWDGQYWEIYTKPECYKEYINCEKWDSILASLPANEIDDLRWKIHPYDSWAEFWNRYKKINDNKKILKMHKNWIIETLESDSLNWEYLHYPLSMNDTIQNVLWFNVKRADEKWTEWLEYSEYNLIAERSHEKYESIIFSTSNNIIEDEIRRVRYIKQKYCDDERILDRYKHYIEDNIERVNKFDSNIFLANQLADSLDCPNVMDSEDVKLVQELLDLQEEAVIDMENIPRNCEEEVEEEKISCWAVTSWWNLLITSNECWESFDFTLVDQSWSLIKKWTINLDSNINLNNFVERPWTYFIQLESNTGS